MAWTIEDFLLIRELGRCATKPESSQRWKAVGIAREKRMRKQAEKEKEKKKERYDMKQISFPADRARYEHRYGIDIDKRSTRQERDRNLRSSGCIFRAFAFQI